MYAVRLALIDIFDGFPVFNCPPPAGLDAFCGLQHAARSRQQKHCPMLTERKEKAKERTREREPEDVHGNLTLRMSVVFLIKINKVYSGFYVR